MCCLGRLQGVFKIRARLTVTRFPFNGAMEAPAMARAIPYNLARATGHSLSRDPLFQVR